MAIKEGQVTFSISDEKLVRLEKIIMAHGSGTINGLLNQIVREYLQRHDGCGVCEHGALPEQKSLEATD